MATLEIIWVQPHQEFHLGSRQTITLTQHWLSWRWLSTKLSNCKSEALFVKRRPNQAALFWSGATPILEVAGKWGKLSVSTSQLSKWDLVCNNSYHSPEVQIVPIGERKFSSSTRILNFQANSKCSTGFWPSYLSRQGRMLKFSIARSSVKMTKKCTVTQWKEQRWQEIRQSVFTAQLPIHLIKSLS